MKYFLDIVFILLEIGYYLTARFHMFPYYFVENNLLILYTYYSITLTQTHTYARIHAKKRVCLKNIRKNYFGSFWLGTRTGADGTAHRFSGCSPWLLGQQAI